MLVDKNSISNELSDYSKDFSDFSSELKTKFEIVRNQFYNIVPGDIIYYGDGEHIGEIMDIDYQTLKGAATFNDLFSSLTVIESVYYANINYVQIRNVTDGKSRIQCTYLVYDDKKLRQYLCIRRLN